MVLFRRTDGAPAALEDQCCHRQLPLSLGKIEGDGLRCGYHGYRFDASGECVEIPGQTTIPANAGVRSFPVVERWHWVWIWPGDPALADPSKIPDLWWADHPDWQFTAPDMVPLACDSRLIIDNVLDATHLTYVHASSIGSGGLTEVQPTVDTGENHVRVSRWVLNKPPPPMYAKAGNFEGNADRWAAVEFRAPAVAINFAGCYYFFGFARAFAHDDPEVERLFSEVMVDVFREDFVILEAQQKRINERPAPRKVSTVNDRASFLARGMIDRLVGAEQ